MEKKRNESTKNMVGLRSGQLESIDEIIGPVTIANPATTSNAQAAHQRKIRQLMDSARKRQQYSGQGTALNSSLSSSVLTNKKPTITMEKGAQGGRSQL